MKVKHRKETLPRTASSALLGMGKFDIKSHEK
jgi:hypothetical protein